MITIFNRRELTLTHDMGRQVAIRNALQSAGIDYVLRTFSSSRVNSGRTRTGSAGLDLTAAVEFHFFVHKRDLDRAKHVLNQL